jgi:hypothetical protein
MSRGNKSLHYNAGGKENEGEGKIAKVSLQGLYQMKNGGPKLPAGLTDPCRA